MVVKVLIRFSTISTFPAARVAAAEFRLRNLLTLVHVHCPMNDNCDRYTAPLHHFQKAGRRWNAKP